jgi:hypothetical protein
MAGMGPPPKSPENRARRNATVSMTKLPAEGRKGPAPEWPLIPDIVTSARRDLAAAKVEQLSLDLENDPKPGTEAALDRAEERLAILERQLAEQKRLEAEVWADLWATPQAVAWERLGWLRDVAQYARHKVLAELGELDSAKEARQWSDRLGLSPMALLRLRWQIAADEVAEKRDQQPAEKSARGRIKAVG